MVPIEGAPLLEHIISQCAAYGLDDIKLLVSYKSAVIEDYFGNGKKFGVNIQYIVEKTPRGTAGALMDSLPHLNSQFLVIYGDTFFDINLEDFWNYHNSKKGDATIFLHPNDHPHDSDLVEVDKYLQITKLYPYPHDSTWKKNLVNAAAYMFNKNVFDCIDLESKKPDIAKDLFPEMLNRRKRLYGYISTEYIKDMGTPERLSKVISDINSGKVLSLKKEAPKIAIFIDRDGTINKEVNFLSDEKHFELIDGASDAISKINETGILAVVVTNQPVIARGDLDETKLQVIHNKMETLLGLQGAYIDRLYYCPHHTDKGFEGEITELKFDCDCRKPKIGMFLKAKTDLNIVIEKSWVIGDSTRDILAAQNAGMKSVLVQTGYGGKDKSFNVKPNFIAKDLNAAVDLILEELK